MPLKGVCSPDPPSENSPARGGSHLDPEAAVCPQHPEGSPSESLLLHEGCSKDTRRAAACLQQLQGLSAGPLPWTSGSPPWGPVGQRPCAFITCHRHAPQNLCVTSFLQSLTSDRLY